MKHLDFPEGYGVEYFRGEEDQITDWLNICDKAILPDNDRSWFDSQILDYPDLDPYKDLTFITHKGERIGTIAFVKHSNGEGYIHMVAIRPDYRGMGFGHILLRLGLEELDRRGCEVSTLTTDDFRYAAVKSYLDAGFRPVLWYDPNTNMKERWEKMLSDMNYPPVEFYDF